MFYSPPKIALACVLVWGGTGNPQFAQQQTRPREEGRSEWTWESFGHYYHTRVELDEILRQHKQWVVSLGESGRQAYFSGANLRGANLGGAVLNGADFSSANLSRADLSGANLGAAVLMERDPTGLNVTIGADLSRADLSGADLSGADLRHANLNGANLIGADLSGAYVAGVDLRGADLRGATLSTTDFAVAVLIGVNLIGADLSGAYLAAADLTGAIYEPREQPSASSIGHARNLAFMEYSSNSGPLVSLRNLLRDAGFRTAERQVIAALRRHDPSWWETVGFDWTCEFGANAVRPLWLVGALWLVCSLFYWLSLHRAGRSGLYLLTSGTTTVNTGRERVRVARLRYRRPAPADKWYWRILRLGRRECHAFSTALLFSLMSVFNIGFRDFNFGRWIRILQPREFDIKARGWPRTVSGVQSLLGVALVVLSLLSYFSTPFDM